MTDTTTGDISQRLLDAMNGVSLILGEDLNIRQIGRPNWLQFLDENKVTDDVSSSESIAATIGRPITDFMAGDSVRQTFASLLLSVLEGDRNAISLEYRCDAPGVRRDMHLAVTPLETADSGRQLLYQSILLSATQRPAIPLFDARIAPDDMPGILTLCCICARVAWPPGAPIDEREWIDAADYYRRGGPEVVSLSHGFCEDCFASLCEEDTLD